MLKLFYKQSPGLSFHRKETHSFKNTVFSSFHITSFHFKKCRQEVYVFSGTLSALSLIVLSQIFSPNQHLSHKLHIDHKYKKQINTFQIYSQKISDKTTRCSISRNNISPHVKYNLGIFSSN